LIIFYHLPSPPVFAVLLRQKSLVHFSSVLIWLRKAFFLWPKMKSASDFSEKPMIYAYAFPDLLTFHDAPTPLLNRNCL